MKLVVRDVANLFSVSEKAVYRWISGLNLPFHRVNDQYRFNRIELLEWATCNRIPLPAEILKVDEHAGFSGLREALESGGIHRLKPETGRAALLRELARLLPLPGDDDKNYLAEVLIARDSKGFTGTGGGIAIPHVRNPIIINVNKPYISLCFLDEPVLFDSADNLPVHALFFIVSPTINGHLQLLSRLSFALQQAEFKAAISEKADIEMILSEAGKIDGMISCLPPEKEGT